MRKIFLPVLLSMFAGAAMADWQYPGTYVGDGAYTDDGSRFVMSARGGASLGFASIKNKVGALSNEYYVNSDYSVVISAAYYDALSDSDASDFTYAGYANLADVPAVDDYQEYAFTAGASIGFTLPGRPQWRFELGWDHITETEYSAAPLFAGNVALTGGDVSDVTVPVQSGAANAKLSTDIISAMAFYDFFDGMAKPMRKIIPYVGVGVGYADSTTVLNLWDPYGDLSADVDLRQNFGTIGDYDVIQFYRSENSMSNVAGLLSVGASYGITSSMFLDLGARVMYVPRVKWSLANSDSTRSRDWFSAENMIFANVMLGLRFEF